MTGLGRVHQRARPARVEAVDLVAAVDRQEPDRILEKTDFFDTDFLDLGNVFC
jgi:hypothetical protein